MHSSRMVLAAKARQASRAANNQVRQIRHQANPPKPADRSVSDPTQCELFIVEGDSWFCEAVEIDEPKQSCRCGEKFP